MKCDKLKSYICGGWSCEKEAYQKSEVDEAIAELKDKCQMHDFFWEGNGFDKMGFKNAIQVREYIDKLKAENAKLKDVLNVWNTYKILADTNKKLRATRRALYKALANWAHEAKFVYDDEFDLWDNMELRCLKKAEEYK